MICEMTIIFTTKNRNLYIEHITMSKKECEQLIVFEKIKKDEITRREGALTLGVSERWVRKKYKRFVHEGDVGLVHRSRQRVSPRRWKAEERERAMDLLRGDWHDFGPTLAAEKLEELQGITINKETLRKAMIEDGVWQGKRRRSTHRKRRPRREMVGLMVQLDGSPHDWFEGRGPRCTLLVFIDDATSKLLWLQFAPSESSEAVVDATKNYIEAHGRPHALYVDYGSVFSVNTNNAERDKKTQWGRMMLELIIEVIYARSPQAKGRVERSNRTLQDRLLKELRLAGISSIDDANTFLRESNYIASHNERFAVTPTQPGNAHRPTDAYDLEAIFRFKDTRVLANDYTLTFKKRLFQLEKQQPTLIRPKEVITVMIHLNGSIDLFIRKTRLLFSEITTKPPKETDATVVNDYQPRKVHENSKRWVRGLPITPESRVKPASPAAEAEKRNFSSC
jgi:hypothetical protein